MGQHWQLIGTQLPRNGQPWQVVGTQLPSNGQPWQVDGPQFAIFKVLAIQVRQNIQVNYIRNYSLTTDKKLLASKLI